MGHIHPGSTCPVLHAVAPCLVTGTRTSGWTTTHPDLGRVFTKCRAVVIVLGKHLKCLSEFCVLNHGVSERVTEVTIH